MAARTLNLTDEYQAVTDGTLSAIMETVSGVAVITTSATKPAKTYPGITRKAEQQVTISAPVKAWAKSKYRNGAVITVVDF